MAVFQDIRELARAKPASTKRLRVKIGDAVSVWATVDKDVVTLEHDYPDFSPQPGMKIVGRGLSLTISSVSGRVLNCE